jgi:hypothetical protein
MGTHCLLQLGDMKHRMYRGVGWQSKPISHSPNTLHNTEWAKESERQLLVRPGSQ